MMADPRVTTFAMNGWFSQTALIAPLPSRMTASNSLNPARLVRRMPHETTVPADRGRFPRGHCRDLAEPRSILVAERESREQIARGAQPDLREVGRPPRADALERLERRLERHTHWTMMARFDSTVIARIPPPSVNGSSRLYPAGFDALFV